MNQVPILFKDFFESSSSPAQPKWGQGESLAQSESDTEPDSELEKYRRAGSKSILDRTAWIIKRVCTIIQNGNCSTPYSRVVTYHSTNKAITDLTSEIRRDPVCSSMYGRS